MFGVSAKLGPAAAVAVVALLAAGSLLAPAEEPAGAGPLTMEAGRTAVLFYPDRVSLSPTTAEPTAQATIDLIFENTPGIQPIRGPDGEVAYGGLWGGVDLHYRATPMGPKYELVVPPSVPLDGISLRVGGSSTVRIAREGRLEIQAGAFRVSDSPLVAWDGAGASVACSYEPRGPQGFGFSCPDWSREHALTIDPLLLSTFIGGSQRDEAMDVALDPSGNIIVVGWTSSTNFPFTPGAYDATPVGGDAFIAKFAPNGSELLFATYLGGTGYEIAYSVATDAAGGIWVAGQTTSTDFPTTADGVARNSSGGLDAFLVRFNSQGNVLDYGTYFGGEGSDRGFAVALDGSGNPIIIGETDSTTLPTTAGAQSRDLTGATDAFLARFNASDGSLVFSTYLGGNVSESGRAVAVLPGGLIAAAGLTNSSDFPIVGAAANVSNAGGYDAFVAVVSPASGALACSTYLGGSGDDAAYDIVGDATGSLFVVGDTRSGDFPTTAGAFQSAVYLVGAPVLPAQAFVTKYTAPAGTIGWSTYLGGNRPGATQIGDDAAVGVALGADGSVTAVGYSSSEEFPTTQGAYRTWLSGGIGPPGKMDAWFGRLSADGSSLLYGSYVGETGIDIARAVAVDAGGAAVVVGATDAYSFPTTDGALDRILNSTEAFMFRALQRRPSLTVSTDPPGRTFALNGTTFTTAFSGLCDEMNTFPIEVGSPQVAGGSRFLFSNWSDGGSQNRSYPCLYDNTLEARFVAEVAFSVTTLPPGLVVQIDGGNVSTPWSVWAPIGSDHTLTAFDPLALNGTRYLLSGWADGGPSSRVLNLSAPLALEARYVADAYSLHLLSVPAGRTLSVDGVNFTCPTSIWVAIGSTHSLDAPSPQPESAGSRFAFASWADSSAQKHDFTVLGPGGAQASFASEFEIRLDSIPGGLPVQIDGIETTMPWSGWRLNGTGISIAPPLTPPSIGGIQYGAMSWSDLGASVRSWSVWRPETLVAFFQPVAFEVRLESNPPGVPISLQGSAVNASVTFQAPNAQVSVSAPPDYTSGTTRYSFVRWSDAGNRSHFTTITGPVTLTAYFSREFEVRVAASPGDALFRIDGVEYLTSALLWMADGSVHTLGASEVLPGGTGRRLAFVSWSDGLGPTHSYTADAPELLNLTYRTEVLLTVKTASGDPTCDVPTCWYPVGAAATISVKSPWNESGGRREILRGWLGNDTSSGTSAWVTMDGPSDLTVLWSQQYYLSVVTRYGMASGSGWYDDGVGASFNLSTTDATVGGVHYRFAGGSGDQLSTGPSGLVFMDGPKSVLAVWEEVRTQPVEAPLWLLVVLIPAAGAAIAFVVVRRRSAAKQAERAWKKPDEFEPVEPPAKR